MAVTVVTPVDLALNVESADLPDASMTSIATGADGGSVDLSTYQGRPVLFKFENSTGGDFTITAGDRPPSQRTGLGTETITMAANDVKFVVLELSRFLQDDGQILFICADNDGSCAVFVLPKGQ